LVDRGIIMAGLGSSPLFETAIALVALWFATATLCSGIVELIAAMLGFRAKHLWRGVSTMLTPPAAGGPGLAVKEAGELPKNLTAPAADSAMGKFIELLPGVTTDSIKRVRNVEAAAASQALVALHEGQALAGTQVGKLIEALPDSVRQAPAELRGWLERWFDGQMSALSRSYRRRIRWWAAAVAVFVVVIAGVDSVGFAERVYQSPTERAVVIAQAQQAVDSGGDAPAACTQTELSARLECAKKAADTVAGFRVSMWQLSRKPSFALGVLGIVVSWGAVAAGAPFWFAILKRMMSLRPSSTRS
jgi:hypothetical protein